MALKPIDIGSLPKQRNVNALPDFGGMLQQGAGAASGAPQAPEVNQPTPVSTAGIPEQRQEYQEMPGGFRNVLGQVGDAISIGAGGQPRYQQGLEQRKFENALATFQHDPERGVQEMMSVAPDVGLQLSEQQQAEEEARYKRMMETAPRMREDLERALKSGKDPGAVVDQYAQSPAGADLFDDEAEREEFKQMLRENPQTAIQALPRGDRMRTLSDEELERMGFEPGAVVQEGPQGELNVIREPEQAEYDRDSIQVRGQEGVFDAAIRPDQSAVYYDKQGNRQVALPGEYRSVSSQISGTEEEVLGSTEMRQLNDLEVNTKNFVDTVGRTLEFLRENPDANTWTGKAAGFVNDLQQEATALARNTGFYEEDIQENNLLDPEKYASKFDELGVANRELRSMLTSLAYQDARRFENGRLSESDVRLAFERIGASSSDPRAISRVLRNAADRAETHFQNSWTTRKGREDAPPPPSVGTERLPSFQEGGGQDLPRVGNDADYRALPSGTEFIGPDGKKRRKP